MLYLTNINLNQNELQNAVIQPLAVAPSNPKLGQIYTDSATGKLKQFNGTTWSTVGVVVESSAVNGNIKVDGVEMTVYELPIASETTLGGIKIGAGFTIDENGVLTNTYTAEEKEKLSNIEAGAQVNIIEEVKVNGESLPINDKSVDVKVPTKLTELTNDANFIDNTVNNLTNYYLKTETYTKSEVESLLAAISTMNVLKVDTLPTEDISTTTIYIVPRTVEQTDDIYNEYLYINGEWELIGNTALDLSNYLQKTGDASATTAVFTTATERVVPASGETLAVIFGKIVKYLTDLHQVAFSGEYSHLQNKPESIYETYASRIVAGQTSVTQTIAASTRGDTIVSVLAQDATTKESVIVDYKVVNDDSVIFSIASAYEHDIVIRLTVEYK